MPKYNVLVCREVWGTFEVNALSAEDAIRIVEWHNQDSEFVQTKVADSQGVYKADLIEELTEEEAMKKAFEEEIKKVEERRARENKLCDESVFYWKKAIGEIKKALD